jgi:tetratricopeptide (TPR) repeat protein
MKLSSTLIVIFYALSCALLVPANTTPAKTSNSCNSPMECALSFAQRQGPDDSYRQNESLSLIAIKYWDLGKPRDALQIIQGIKCPDRVNVSTYLAKEARQAGMMNHAEKLVDLTLSCVKDGMFYQYKSIEDCVRILLELQQYDKALVAAEMIEDENYHKASAYTLVANSFIGMNRNEKASTLLGQALDQALKSDEQLKGIICESLGEIAAGYSRLGNSEKASSILSMALEIAEKDKMFYRDRNKGAVAIGYIKAGFESRALEIANTLGLPAMVETYISFAHYYLQIHQESKAKDALSKLVAEITDQSDTDYAYDLHEISEAYLDMANPEEALNVARNGRYFGLSAIKIAKWSLKNGKTKSGVEALDLSATHYRAIVSEKREEILPMMSYSKAQDKASNLSTIADEYIKFDRMDSAEETVRAIDLPQWKAMKLADLAVAIAQASSKTKAREILDEALRISESSKAYPHDQLQETALARIAKGYATAGEKKQSLKLFVQALEKITDLEDYDAPINRLAMIGFVFESAGLKADKGIRSVLHKIMKKLICGKNIRHFI